MLDYLPRFFTKNSIILFFIVLVFANTAFFSRFLGTQWILFGIVEVVGFFYFANKLTIRWREQSEKEFIQKLFVLALSIRLIWVLFSYFFYQFQTGQPFEFQTGDAKGYHESAMWILNLFKQDKLDDYFKYMNGRYSDMGYSVYLSIQYFFTGNSIFFARIVKAFFGAWTVVLVYKLSLRNFGDEVARMASIFAMLMPNLILYCGLHLKEIEMVFLVVLFLERTDYIMKTQTYKFAPIAVATLVVITLFFFRTVLGVTALFALISSILFSSSRVLGMGKRLMFAVWVAVTIGYLAGGSVANEVEEAWKARTSNQTESLKWRSEREGGNKLSKSVSKSYFIPLIFTIPFPTFVNSPTQENQMIIAGGNFVKNVLSVFVLLGLYKLFRERNWRNHSLLIFFAMGYLLVVAQSAFAHSERFHQPAIPVLLIFAAYGVSRVSNKFKNTFLFFSVFLFLAIIAWSWFKVVGRGL